MAKLYQYAGSNEIRLSVANFPVGIATARAVRT